LWWRRSHDLVESYQDAMGKLKKEEEEEKKKKQKNSICPHEFQS